MILWFQCSLTVSVSHVGCSSCEAFQSEHAICSCAVLSQHAFATFAPPPLLLACHLRWHGRARALQAACSFSCILLVCHRAKLASFNPISQIHSDVKENETNKLQFSFHPVCHLPILLEVGEWHQLMTKGQRRHEYWRNNCVSERLVASWAILVSTVNKANETRQRESSSPTAD